MDLKALKTPTHEVNVELLDCDSPQRHISTNTGMKMVNLDLQNGMKKLLLVGGGHKRNSSMMSSTSSCTSGYTERYTEDAEKLDWNVEQLTDAHIKIIEKCNKYRKGDAQIHYDHIASNYEGMYLKMGYPDPKYVANYVTRFTKRNRQNPEDIKVIDFGCGTGLVGKYLAESGFKNITGLDISPKMLDEAASKGVYSDLVEHTLCNPVDFPTKFKNHFDFVTCAGLINNNHMDYLLFEEMLLSVKKGGFIIFATRFSYMGKYWYDEIIKEMHDSGRWTLLATETFFKYDKID